MAYTVTMPQLGESVTEGTIARWLKQPGDQIAKYESIAEVVTDKVNAEIPAPADGTLGEIVAGEGSVVAVGQPICTIETGAGAPDAPAAPAPQPQQAAAETPAPSMPAPQAQQPNGAAQPASEPQPQPVAAQLAQQPPQQAAQPQPQQQPQARAEAQASAAPSPLEGQGVTSVPASTGGGAHVTPAVRMLAREHDVDLDAVEGSGLGGRVTKKDVLEYVQKRDSGEIAQAPRPAAAAPAAAPAQPAPVQPAGASSAPAAAAPAPSLAGGDQVVPLSQVRRSIAEHMSRSRQTSPHAWLMMEVDMSRVVRLRNAHKDEFKSRYGVSLTYLPFVARATIEALRRHPYLNSSWSDQGIVLKHDIHLGIAVALEDNLIVPVIRSADRLSIAGLAQTMADLGERARSNRLKLDEIQGGTFTLNNTGALGTVMTQSIINQPQAAILAMDAVVKRPVVTEDDAIAIRPIMNLCISFDHRIVDGLQATRFVKEVKELLENLEESALL